MSGVSETNTKTVLGVIDIIVCGAMLLLSLGVGVFYSYKDRSKKSTDVFFFGKRNMPAIPIALSTSMTLMSAVTVLSFPMETYKYGVAFIWTTLFSLPAAAFAAVYFIPTYRRLECKSVYEMTRMGVIMYLPSLALSAVTPIKLPIVISVTMLICTAYTTMGGMNAVVWTDVLQSSFMFVGMVAMLMKCSYKVRNEDVIQTLKDAGRWNLFDFSSNPTKRVDVWNITLGMGVQLVFTFCCHQGFVQRYLSCQTTKDAQISAVVSAIPIILFISVSVAVGSVTFVYFKSCDPVAANVITTQDKTIPYLAIVLFQSYPGLAGLLVAAAYSGAIRFTDTQNTTTQPSYLIRNWFSLSHYLYAPIVLGITVAMGVLVSLITGRERASQANPDIFVPLFDNKKLPESVKMFFRFGVPYKKVYLAGKEQTF